MSTLIILRGNSGSGKSTIATELRKKLGNRAIIISKDTIRDEFISSESIHYYNILADIISDIAKIGIKYNSPVIIDGMVSRPKHDHLLFDLINKFDNSFVYSFDIPFSETVERHKTRQKSELFGENEMKKWYKERDHLNIENETIIDHTKSKDEIVQLILNQVGEYIDE